MMEIIKKLIAKITARIESLHSEDVSSYSEDYKKYLSVEEMVYRKIRDTLELEILSVEEKQARRINLLASCRKAGGDCSNNERAIYIYDEIRKAFPYIKALNHLDQIAPLETLCSKEMQLIDNSLTGNVKEHITKKEVEGAFKPYFEKVAPFKMDMFNECYEKIEFLYNELIKQMV
jgi:hypothetical protein